MAVRIILGAILTLCGLAVFVVSLSVAVINHEYLRDTPPIAAKVVSVDEKLFSGQVKTYTTNIEYHANGTLYTGTVKDAVKAETINIYRDSRAEQGFVLATDVGSHRTMGWVFTVFGLIVTILGALCMVIHPKRYR